MCVVELEDLVALRQLDGDRVADALYKRLLTDTGGSAEAALEGEGEMAAADGGGAGRDVGNVLVLARPPMDSRTLVGERKDRTDERRRRPACDQV